MYHWIIAGMQECVQVPYVPVIYKITNGLFTSD